MSILSSIFHGNGSRSVLIRRNILAGFAIKGWSALTVLLSVPLTLKGLGVYENGIWLTISSILVWIDMLDIGLGNGLRNQLTIHLAQHDTLKARQTVASTLAMLTLIVGLALMVIAGLVALTDVYEFLNVDPLRVGHLPQILLVAASLVCTTFVMKLVGNVYMSLQLPAVSNLLVALGQTLALAGTFALYVSGSTTLFRIVLVNTASPLLVYLAACPYTFRIRYPELCPHRQDVDLGIAKRMMTLGIRFFALQIASVILFMSANLIISKLYSPDLVNPYQITYRYFSLVLILFTIICVPFWNATTEAYTKGDVEWIRRASRKMRLVTTAMLALLGLMVIVSSWVYAWWIGPEVIIPMRLSLAMACYLGILISSMRYSYFLNGIGALRLQLITALTAALLFIPLAWLTAHQTQDLTWFVGVLCLVNIPGLVINHIQFNRIIAGKATGLWKE